MVVSSLRVAIIGAGVGGLGTAIALSRQGYSVTIYEAASKVSLSFPLIGQSYLIC